jgi:hypothetical protein
LNLNPINILIAKVFSSKKRENIKSSEFKSVAEYRVKHSAITSWFIKN